jgi:hypothetical protein
MIVFDSYQNHGLQPSRPWRQMDKVELRERLKTHACANRLIMRRITATYTNASLVTGKRAASLRKRRWGSVRTQFTADVPI